MLDLSWRVPIVGYEWINSKGYPHKKLDAGVQGWYLTERTEVGHQFTATVYPVFKKTGLFREFGATALTRDGVLVFANTHGSLKGNTGIPIDKPVKAEPGSSFFVSGEKFELWSDEISAMKHALDLWDKVKVSDRSGLAQFIYWGDGYSEVSHVPPADSSLKEISIASHQHRPERLTSFRSGDTLEPAMYAVQEIVNHKLREHEVTPRLMWDRSRPVSRLRVMLNPTNLLSALWAQFAYAIEGGRDYRNCDQCQQWFEVAGERREDARFCSNACRFKAYRLRRKQAQRLHGEGKSFRSIAEELGSDVQTVKGWVSK